MASLGSVLGGTRQSSMLGGLPRSGSGLGPILSVLSFANIVAGSAIVPVYAALCEAIAVGASGGSGGVGSNYDANSRGGSGGGGAMGRSRFAVASGKPVSYSVTNASGRGAPGSISGGNGGQGGVANVSYGGVVIAQGDGGYGGIGVNAPGAIGADGSGGLASQCVGNLEIRPGQPGGLQGGGIQAPNTAGVGFFNSVFGAYRTTAGAGNIGYPSSGYVDLVNATGFIGGGASGTYGTQASGAYGGVGGIILIFYGAP